MSTIIGNLRAVLSLDSAAFQAGLRDSLSGIRRTGREMQRIGQSMALAVSAPLAGLGGVVVKTAGNFEASMNRVKAATGATGGEFDALRSKAMEMGRTTQFSASQSADAIEVLAKNGLNATQILGGALEASMLLAAASGTDLANAGDIATDVMLQFGKQAGDLTGLVDDMTGVLLVSKFGIDDYRLALAQAGGVAGGLGVEFEDFNAAIAGTSSLFASGSDAGTSFKTFLQRLVPQSAPARKAMKDLNLQFFEADGSMKSMAEIAQELKNGLAGLSEEARNEALSQIFGTDAMRTAIGLAEQGADGIERLRTEIGKASALDQAKARMEGFNGSMLELKSALEGLALAVADSGLLQFVTDLVKSLTQLVLKLSETSPELLKWGSIAAAAAIAAGPLLIGFGLLVQAVGPLLAGLRLVASAAALLGGPFTIAAAAIAGAVYLIYKNWDEVGPWFETLSGNLETIMSGFAEVVRGIFTGDFATIVDGFKEIWDGLTGYWKTLWEGVVGILTYAWENGIKPITDALGITDEIERAWNAVRHMFDTVMDGIAAAFEAAWERIKPVVEKIEEAAGRIDRGYNRITGAVKGPISSGYDPAADAGNDVIAPPIPAGNDVAAGYVAGVNAGRGAAYDAGVGLGAATEEGLRDHTETESPSKLFARLGTFLTDDLSDGIDRGRNDVVWSIQSVADGVIGVLEDAAFRGGSIIDGLRQMAGSMLGNAASGLFRSGVGSLFGMMNIPGFAAGTAHFRGGMAMLHERGGELAVMPSGSTVVPHDLSKRMLDRTGGGVAEIVLHAPAGFTATQLGEIEGVSVRVVQSSAPDIVGQAVSRTDRAMRKTKAFGGR